MTLESRLLSNFPRLAPLAVLLFGCGGDDVECGPGAKASGDRCIAIISSCAPGTTLMNGACVAICGPGESWSGSACVPDKTCAPGTTLVDGECVPACGTDGHWNGQECVTVPTCALGTYYDDDAGACVPDDTSCGEGTHFDGGVCVPDTTACGPGTHLDGGVCVPDSLPEPDVLENPAGTADIDLPAAGAQLSIGGTVDTPADGDNDGFPDPDYDRFAFSAQAGTWLRIHATSEGAAHPAFVVISDDVDANGAPLYARYAVNPGGVETAREVYLPFTGDYTLIVSDYTHVTADLFGWLALPVGGDDFSYYLTLENLGTPTATPLPSAPASELGTLAGGALSFVELTGLAEYDVRVLRHLGSPPAQAASDVFGALMLFGPTGALQREGLALATDEDAAILFAATESGDHLVVIDHLLTIGPNDAFELLVEEVATVDCDTEDCSSGTIPEGTSSLLSWDALTGTLFTAGAYVPDTATDSLQVELLDAGLVPMGVSSSASKYGPAKLRHYVAADQRLYLLLRGSGAAEIPSYTLDVRQPVAQLLTPGANTGLPVHDMPPDTYEQAGWARYAPLAGQVILSKDFVTTDADWMAPVETYMTTTFEPVPPALDVTNPGFPNAVLAPLAAFVPTDRTFLYRVTEESGADISGATYDTSFHALSAVELGTVSASPVSAMGQSIDAVAAVASYSFFTQPGQVATITVTPGPTAQMQPEVWVATPGRQEYASGSHRWIPDQAEPALGVVSKSTGSGPGAEASTQYTVEYDGVHIVFVRDVGTGAAGDPFDIEVAVD